MPAIANNSQPVVNESVTAISANARVDYILRFSKQLVIVLDEHEQGYASVTSKLLTTVSDSHNVALMSLSSKLNDIQIRCRIAEQLFPNLPFDPEISLAKTILNRQLKSSEGICIVIEQAQHISLQLLHELTQLVELAKKSEQDIQVVLFGAFELGKLVADNQVLFNQKISMVSAQSGQLIAPNAKQFKESQSLFPLSMMNKLLIAFVVLAMVTITTIVMLYQRDSLSFSQVDTQVNKADVLVSDSKVEAQLTSESTKPAANVMDVLTALNAREETALVETSASQEDILSALSPTVEAKQQESAEPRQIVSQQTKDNTVNALNNMDYSTTNYYAQFEQGAVIQFANLLKADHKSVNQLVEDFKRSTGLEQVKYYQRQRGHQSYVVITSVVHPDKAQARTALNNMPEQIRTSGAWLKSVAAVKKEMLSGPRI